MSDVQHTFISDWSGIFDVVGKPVNVAVYDVAEYDRLYWDHQGVWVVNQFGNDFTIKPIEVIKVTLPGRLTAR